jgi:hypothetical protein
MSVFKVQLGNFHSAGPADVGMPVAGALTHRTLYAPGPHLVNRLLTDGETFTDCNYWKQFAHPQVGLNEAFIVVLSDDGSTWSKDGVSTTPRVYNLTTAAGSAFAANQAPILADTGGTAVFAQITNNGAGAVTVRLNGNTNAVFTLPAGTSQVFNAGDLSLSLIEVANGTGSSIPVQILVSVNSSCQS